MQETPPEITQTKSAGPLIRVDDVHSLGIIEYDLILEETYDRFTKLYTENIWSCDGKTAVKMGKLKPIPKQYVPFKQGLRLNSAILPIENTGSYVLEFFDNSKEHVGPLHSMQTLPTLNRISEQVKALTGIDLATCRDRLGNILFQFPVTLLRLSAKFIEPWSGMTLRFHWHGQVTERPEANITMYSTVDGVFMGAVDATYNKEDTQDLVTGNLDINNLVMVFRKNPDLLLNVFDCQCPRIVGIGGGWLDDEKRKFFIDGVLHELKIVTANDPKANAPDYLTHITASIYAAERQKLEESLAFKQYFNGQESIAMEQVRNLIARNCEHGVYLWDPFLRAKYILNTLFFSTYNGVMLRAIGAIDKDTKLVYGQKGQSPQDIIQQEAILLTSSSHDNHGLNLEFRMQYENHGYNFHDRFLMFPGTPNLKPLVYSLGSSVNSLGKSHHIIQEVPHPQRVIDAFNDLWNKLNAPACLVWKYPA